MLKPSFTRPSAAESVNDVVVISSVAGMSTTLVVGRLIVLLVQSLHLATGLKYTVMSFGRLAVSLNPMSALNV